MSFIGTYSGREYHFLDPKPEQICIEDIARALSMTCRYSGHVKYFYSVAEHSVILCDHVFGLTNNPQHAFDALMHDASEAYVNDLPRPIKESLPNYKDIERKAEIALQEKYGFNPKSKLIDYLDRSIVADEVAALFKTTPDWVEQFTPIGADILCWSPAQAEAQFSARFVKYTSQLEA